MAKKIIKKEDEKQIVQERKKSYYIKECDCIVPAHFIDWDFFSSNVKSWLEELPIRKLFFGCNNPDDDYIKTLKDYLTKTDNRIEFIDQRGIKTLGMQIVDLMKRVETELFCYCHTDAQPTRYSFLVLEADMEDDVGIVESERVQYSYDKPKSHPDFYPFRYYIDRSFSGYQLIRKKAIESFFDKIEDDYVYRNEDIIFQNVCMEAGFRYIKSFGVHIHTCSNTNHKWTPQGKQLSELEAKALTFDMQIKGIVKYCVPNDITKKAWQDGFGQCYRSNKLNVFDFIEDFVKKVNPIWEQAIKDIINQLLGDIYR